MNLFFNASINEFQKLLRVALNDKSIHELVIDYDGEVLLDPQLQQPELDLDRFKVHFHVDENIKKEIVSQPGHLKKLFNKVLSAWNN